MDYGGYVASQCDPSQHVSVFSQEDLDSYLVNYGWDGQFFRGLRIGFNPIGRLDLASPCEIRLLGENSALDVSAQRVCLYGRGGVTASGGPVAGERITTGNLSLVSEEGGVTLGRYLQVETNTTLLRAWRGAKVGANTNLVTTEQIQLISTGPEATSEARISSGTQINARDLLLQSNGRTTVGSEAEISLSGIFALDSTGELDGATSAIWADVLATADEVRQKGERNVFLGAGARVTARQTYELSAMNTCVLSGSAAIVASDRMGNCFK